MYDFEGVISSINGLETFNIENLDLIPLLYQTGYLTIKKFDERKRLYTLGYPNEEVKQSYIESLSNAYVPNARDKAIVIASELEMALANLHLDKLKTIINALFKGIPYDHWQQENEYFYHAILHLTFNLMGLYTDSEVHTADGRLYSLVPLENAIFCFEFKLDKSAKEAIEQIESKGYLEPYRNDGRKLFAIGVNFSVEKKEIEEILWLEIR